MSKTALKSLDELEKDLDEIANKLDQCWKLSLDTSRKIQELKNPEIMEE